LNWKKDAIGGLTSNPSIFEKAIRISSDYDEDIAALSRQKSTNDDIFYGLAAYRPGKCNDQDPRHPGRITINPLTGSLP